MVSNSIRGLSSRQREILEGISKRYGQDSLPQVSDYAQLPDEYWNSAEESLADQDRDEPFWSRLLSGITNAKMRSPADIVGAGLKVLQRAEEVGQLAGPPIVQGAKEGFPLLGVNPPRCCLRLRCTGQRIY